MAELLLHGKPIRTVFHLLGKRENDLTYSLGWALAQSPRFVDSLVQSILGIKPHLAKVAIRLQQTEKEAGITDVEIESPGEFFLLIEAKRGWKLPTIEQLEKYSKRRVFRTQSRVPPVMAVLTKYSEEDARPHLEAKSINGVKIIQISWKHVAELAANARHGARHTEMRILAELREYLESVMEMQNHDSNEVYVVSLGRGTPKGSTLKWIDIVEKKGKYFHPVGINGWPKEPPNYIAFRYRGKLQSIHYIERHEVFTDPHKWFPAIPSKKWVPHFLYFLSPPFKPQHDVKAGKIWNRRVKCMLDTLFLATTISEALAMSRQRSSKAM